MQFLVIWYFLGDGDLFGKTLDEPTDDIFSRPSRLFSSRPTLFDDNDEDEVRLTLWLKLYSNIYKAVIQTLVSDK